MKVTLTIWLIVGSMAAACAKAVADPEIVVAIRYLKAQGTSHAQLFLFRQDGHLLRQLTNENVAQVTNPRFAPNGETIVFTRELGINKEYRSVEPHGKNLHVFRRRLPGTTRKMTHLSLQTWKDPTKDPIPMLLRKSKRS